MEFKEYQRITKAQFRPYIVGEDLAGITISEQAAKDGSPKDGDMIARNPANHADQWLVSKAYFDDNFAPIESISDEIEQDISNLVKKIKIGGGFSNTSTLITAEEITGIQFSIAYKHTDSTYSYSIEIYSKLANRTIRNDGFYSREALNKELIAVLKSIAFKMQMKSPDPTKSFLMFI